MFTCDSHVSKRTICYANNAVWPCKLLTRYSHIKLHRTCHRFTLAERKNVNDDGNRLKYIRSCADYLVIAVASIFLITQDKLCIIYLTVHQDSMNEYKDPLQLSMTMMDRTWNTAILSIYEQPWGTTSTFFFLLNCVESLARISVVGDSWLEQFKVLLTTWESRYDSEINIFFKFPRQSPRNHEPHCQCLDPKKWVLCGTK